MSRILVSGSLAYDRIMDFPGLFKDHFLADKLHNLNISFQVQSLAEHFGGTAGNIAYNLALLEEKATILASAGSDFQKYRKHLQKFGVSEEGIYPVIDALTSCAHIITDRGDNQIAAFFMGAGARPYAGSVEVLKDDIILIGAGNIEDMERFSRRAKKVGAVCLFDPGQAIPALRDDALKESIAGAQTLFVNDYELAMILKRTGWKEEELHNQVSTLVVTLGGEGSRVISGGHEYSVHAVPVRDVKDPTGAGDAYRAGYLKAMRHGKTPLECAMLGSTIAAYAVECIGTQEHTCTFADVKKRYEESYGTALEI